MNRNQHQPSIFKVMILLVGLGILFKSCKKKGEEFNLPTFFGITQTNIFGLKIGSIDTTDWNYFENWTENEKVLFLNYSEYDFENDEPQNISMQIAFPNACLQSFTLLFKSLNNTEPIEINLCVVNQNGIKLFENQSRQETIQYQINLQSKQALITENKVRVYYIIKTAQNKSYKGHGDVEVNF